MSLDPVRRSVEVDGRELNLTATEYLILELLMRRSPAVVDRKHIAEHAWEDETDPLGSNAIDVQLSRLRAKLAERRHPHRHRPWRGLSTGGSVTAGAIRLTDVRRQSLRVALAATAIVAVAYLVVAGAVFIIQTKTLTDQIDARLSDFVRHGGRAPTGDGFQPGSPDRPFSAPILFWLTDSDGTVYTNSNLANLPTEYQAVSGWANAIVSGTQIRLYGQPVSDAHIVVGQTLDSVTAAQSQLAVAELADRAGPADRRLCRRGAHR